MELFTKIFGELRWVLYFLPILVLIIRFYMIKKNSVSKLLAGFPFTLLIICFLIDLIDTPDQETVLLAFYMVALGLIEHLIDENKKTFSRTTFYEQYSKIEKEWESFGEKTPNVEEKKYFIMQSLEAIENCITAPEVKENSICKRKPEIEEFVTQSGGMNANYFWMCCNKDQFYKNVLVSLYSNLFLQLNETILKPIQLDAAGTAVKNCYVPEFVSTELTRTLLSNPDIQFQYNTSVSSIADYAKDNCARSIDRNPNSTVQLKRIIIYDNDTIDPKDLNIVCKWHKDNEVDLEFIKNSEAERIFRSCNYQGEMDFSVIGMGTSCVLLEALKKSKETFAGFDHDMYELNFRVDSNSEAKRMFNTLWQQAHKYDYDVNSNNFYIK